MAAAGDLLRGHHSSCRQGLGGGAMGRRSYGHGANAEDASLRQQLLQLLGGGGPGGRQGGGGGGGGKGGGRHAGTHTASRGGGVAGGRSGGGPTAANPRLARRPGDWVCPRCQYYNFAYRTACHQCGTRSSDGGPGQRAARDAPPGGGPSAGAVHRTAAEAREAASRAGQPSFRVPRAAGLAAAAATAAPPASGARGHPPQLTARGAGGVASGAVGGASRGASGQGVHGAVAEGQGAAPGGTGTGSSGQATAARQRWADAVPPCDADAAMGDEGSDYADEDAAWEDDQEEQDEGLSDRQPTAAELKARYEQECRAVRALERVEWGSSETSAALAAARSARDLAEQRWRDALVARPVAWRMAQAQRKLDRAERSVDKARADLQRFEEEVERRRGVLEDVLDQAEQRLQSRLGDLDQLHREAGELAAANADGAEAWHAPTVDEEESLRTVLAGELQVFVELLEEGTEAREKANAMLARLATMSAAPGHHQHYSIHTDEEGVDEDGGYQLVTRRGRAAAGGKGTGTVRSCASPVWTSGSNGRWNRQRPTGTDDDPMGDARTEGRSSLGLDTAHAPGQGGTQRSGRGKRAAEEGGEHEEPRAQGHSKSHRGDDEQALPAVESTGDDAARALKLHQEQQVAIEAAKAAQATFGDQTSMQIAGQLYAHKVHLIKARAAAAGVAPMADGRELLRLTPEELNTWVEKVLVQAENQKGHDSPEEKDL